MKTLASTLVAAAFAIATVGAASACPYSNKQASSSLTDSGSYDTAQNQQDASGKTQ